VKPGRSVPVNSIRNPSLEKFILRISRFINL
jgi:hypothetical protein